MPFQLNVPSKTFLLGEYAVLQGAPAILLASELRFEMTITSHTHSHIEGINPASPAGKLLQREADFYQRYHIQFTDPYQGLGGFGASSAQFVMLDAFKYFVKDKKFSDDELLNDYIELAWDGKSMMPSGADLIAQKHGRICFIHKAEQAVATFQWPFIDIGYALIHTGNKLATHEHLKDLKAFNIASLNQIIANGLNSLVSADSDLFIQSVRAYADSLQILHFTAQSTQTLLHLLYQHPDILAAKGCGAMGADVILVLFNNAKQTEIITWLKEKKLNVITHGQEVASGLEFKEID